MKIGVDVRSLASGVHSGVEEYTVSFLRSLFAQCPRDEFVLFANAYKGNLRSFDWVSGYPNVTLKQFKIPNKLLNLSLWLFAYPKLDRLIGGCDVFFAPNISFLALSRKTRLVLTVHDLSFEHFAQTFSWRRRLWHALVCPRALVRRAARVVAVSRATRRDIHMTYRTPARKIVAIANAAAPEYRVMSRNDIALLDIKEKYKLPFRFILYLGTVEPRKNIAALVSAYEALREHYPGEYDKVQLVIAGARGWKSRDIFAQIATSDYAGDIRVLGFVDEVDKPILYNLATVFVYPSLFEGFGLPVLEALGCGTPVITSNNSSLPEVVGDSALMIDPDRPEEITQAIHAVLADANLRKTLQERAPRQAAKFSWKNSATKFDTEILSPWRK